MLKQRIILELPPEIAEELKSIMDRNPTLSRNALLCQMIHYAAVTGFTIGVVTNASAPVSLVSMKKRADLFDPKDICAVNGGEVKDGVCNYFRYEVDFSGAVSKDPRTISLEAIKKNPADFKKMALTSFNSLAEAEAAHKANPLL